MEGNWTSDLHTNRTRDIHSDFEEWAKAHLQIKQSSVPEEGRDYVAHVANLMPILQAFSELNPIAKGKLGSDDFIILPAC